MERDLGIVRAGLDAQVAARAGRVELVARERGQRAQAGGPALLQPEALEDARPEADGDREPPRAEADGLAGVGGRHLGRALDGARRLPGGHPPRRVGPRAQELAQIRGALGGEVERAEHEPRLRGRRHAGLMRALERDDLVARRLAAGRRRVADREAGATRGGEPEGSAAGERAHGVA